MLDCGHNNNVDIDMAKSISTVVLGIFDISGNQDFGLELSKSHQGGWQNRFHAIVFLVLLPVFFTSQNKSSIGFGTWYCLATIHGFYRGIVFAR